MDDALRNVTDALVDRGMWNDTVLVFASDNGGPQIDAHWNAGMRGGKWTHLEGGVRVPAFVSSERLPRHVRGTWYNATAHLVDWLPTLLGLAGLRGHQLGDGLDSSLGGLDGFDLWASLSAGDG